MDERKANILRTVVEEYIATAQPVGSSHVAASPDVAVSSATVRNDMAALEQEGYLAQPHTSAGRVPTDKGYRYFVDHLGRRARLAPGDAQQVRQFFADAHGELEVMLAETTRLLAGLTRHTAVVVGPPHERAVVRSVQLVGLNEKVVLLVVVLSNGVIAKHVVEVEAEPSEEVLAAAGRLLGEELVDRGLDEARKVTMEGSAAPHPEQALAGRALQVLVEAERDAEAVYTSGASAIAQAFDAVATVREVLRLIEEQYVVVGLLRDVLDRGLDVAIGTETGIEPLADCSVVVAPYMVDGEQAGTIGVLGPTRMDYPQALAAVGIVSRRLGQTLSEG